MPSPTLTTTPTAAEFTGDRLDCATMAGWLERGDDVRLLDVRSPAEFETAYYSQKPTALEAVTQ